VTESEKLKAEISQKNEIIKQMKYLVSWEILNAKPIDFAINYAKKAHAGHVRKYTTEPYVSHPIAVAGLVASVTDDKEMIISAILHDVVEDTSATLGDIYHNFGRNITLLVNDLTDISKPGDGKRSRRKTIDRLHIDKASHRAKTIKLADLIDNTKTIVQFDPKFAAVYMQEKRALLGVLKEGDETLYKIAGDLVERYFKKYELNKELKWKKQHRSK